MSQHNDLQEIQERLKKALLWYQLAFSHQHQIYRYDSAQSVNANSEQSRNQTPDSLLCAPERDGDNVTRQTCFVE
jgi:hypothetical protein